MPGYYPEDLLWMQIGEREKIWAIADEDLERSTENKTSAVHFLRFELDDSSAQALKNGDNWLVGVQHPVYTYQLEVEGETRRSLIKDLD